LICTTKKTGLIIKNNTINGSILCEQEDGAGLYGLPIAPKKADNFEVEILSITTGQDFKIILVCSDKEINEGDTIKIAGRVAGSAVTEVIQHGRVARLVV
jgi:hypothetical protein